RMLAFGLAILIPAFFCGEARAAASLQTAQQRVVTAQETIAGLQEDIRSQLKVVSVTSDPAVRDQISADMIAAQLKLVTLFQNLQHDQLSLASLTGTATRSTDPYIPLPAVGIYVEVVQTAVEE
ncbi:MAG: hypothetical protein AB7H77_08510, partial [Bdellovibrionales bacterium]